MRISIIKGDRGFDETHSRRVQEVTLDDRPMVGVVTADEEEGFVLCLVTDPLTGQWLRDGATGEFQLARQEGRVVVRLRAPDARAWDASRRGEAKVQVGRDGVGDVLVQVYSNARPGAIKQVRLARADQPSTSMALCQKAGLMGGYAAELLADQFGDRIDPSAAAAEAVRQCHKMLAAEARGIR